MLRAMYMTVHAYYHTLCACSCLKTGGVTPGVMAHWYGPQKRSKVQTHWSAGERNSYRNAGVNQQSPVHQFRMRPFKPFWG